MIPEKVQKVLRAHDLEALEFEPGSTPTVAMAARSSWTRLPIRGPSSLKFGTSS